MPWGKGNGESVIAVTFRAGLGGSEHQDIPGIRREVRDAIVVWLGASPPDVVLQQDLPALHPTVGGYRKMADAWFDALKASGVLARCRK